MNYFKLNKHSLGQLIQSLTDMVLTGKNYRVSIKEWRESRSLSQNSLMWKWLAEIDKQAPLQCDSQVSGAEMWHEVFKHYYCPVKTIKNSNATLEIRSTKALDVGEMTFYLNKIECWCIDRGIRLTIPADSEYSKLTEQQNR